MVGHIAVFILAGAVRDQGAGQHHLHIVHGAGLQEAVHVHKVVGGLRKGFIAPFVGEE